ncbi:hypothetical protein P153DRAFT_348622 [Dothidotthia symphoricarpi CBS 119687]|uniref:Zn(2)-C6 fungal-type domain-containing protein n=1 Tax=Dothidotthia symphoricarpi CBS 119687 TaxID=1392245 RepID=A0A6A6A4D0_9PLEO|nr:uncharacterized protein P153DRAFT_348622 [Dothidotthia symphoricarpi CBS 119687]KAF2125451.1 hypothetical protein P153DRAFT_348622 [Dothidotthia symphoricarpi CBS 119687]
MDQEAPLQPQSRPLLTQKPKRTVTLGACVACRKRKSKCDGSRPVCTCCAQKDTECVYELGPNEKPSQAMKRKNEEMQGELLNLRQLYDFLRLRPEHEAQEILRRIRANPPDASPSQRIQELADFVRHGDLHIQRPSYRLHSTYYEPGSVTLPPLRLALDSPGALGSDTLSFPGMFSMGSDGPSTQRRRLTSDVSVPARSDSQSSFHPTSIEAIINPSSSAEAESPKVDRRLRSVQNWTKATNDVTLLVELLTRWTTCEHDYFHYLERDSFLDDMASGRTDFCSELLVNAMLASACLHSPAIRDRAKPFSKKSFTIVFYEEAMRLWKLEEGRVSLTNLHSAIALYIVFAKYCRDKDGYVYLLEACRIGHELGLFQHQPSQASQKPPHVTQAKWDKVRDVTAWSLFNFQLSMSFVYSFPVPIRTVPSVTIPYRDKPESEAFFRSECARHVIILDSLEAFSSRHESHRQRQMKPEQIERIYQRLKVWFDSRPSSLNPDKVPSRENLTSAMHYHIHVFHLFQPFLEGEAYRDRSRSLVSTSLKEIRRLLALHELRHGWDNAIPMVIYPLTVASFGGLEELFYDHSRQTQAEQDELYQGLLTCVRIFDALASYMFYAQLLFRLLTQKCQKLGIQLPVELQSILNSYLSEEWTKNAASLVSSSYVVDTRKPSLDVENARMDDIISQWEGLALDEIDAGKTLTAIK